MAAPGFRGAILPDRRGYDGRLRCVLLCDALERVAIAFSRRRRIIVRISTAAKIMTGAERIMAAQNHSSFVNSDSRHSSLDSIRPPIETAPGQV